nr:hypothetical protein [uncultured Desulfobulbus sp.]
MAKKLPINPDRNDHLTGAMMQAAVDAFREGKATREEVKSRIDRVVRTNSVSKPMQDKTPKGSRIHHDHPIGKDLDSLLDGDLTVEEVIERSHETTEMTDEEHRKWHEKLKEK